MTQRRHHLPFGAEILPDRRVRFRLWAPEASHVDVCLEGRAEELVLPMAAEDRGWFGVISELAAAGTRYRFRIDGGLRVPDPASRYQPDDVHGASQVVDPTQFEWLDGAWRGRPWEEAVIYELHVGTFTPAGTFQGVIERLDYLADLGVTALELMPVGDFPGRHNWGYDGVFPYAPDSRYGRPDDLKRLVQEAHRRGLMVLLDVVYNHFGPEGNYLHRYAPQFFTDRYRTPWGAAINFDGAGSGTVRNFFVQNALFWLREYNVDGLRLDAVHAICDSSTPDFLVELARAVQRLDDERHIHLVIENDRNRAAYLRHSDTAEPARYDAQWNDDFHHALHVLLTGETDGYYQDYAAAPGELLGRCLTEGYAYQGEVSAYRHGERRGEPSADLPPTAFVSFLQNHDQIGNRAYGERITALAKAEALRAATAVMLLAPAPPLLFMGQEWAATEPFPFFCDFSAELGARVAKGRREEFARFPSFRAPATRATIPDPLAPATFAAAVLDWAALESPAHRAWLAFHRALLAIRAREIVPRLQAIGKERRASYALLSSRALRACWALNARQNLTLLANLDDVPCACESLGTCNVLYVSAPALASSLARGTMPPWSVTLLLLEGTA